MLRIAATLALSVMAQVVLAADPSGTKELDFEIPPGFKAVERGEIVVYCYKDATVGTRFKSRKCYNKEQLRAYVLASDSRLRFPLLDAR